MLAGILLAVAAAEVFIAVTAGVASGHGWGYFLDHFVVTNAFIGASLALAGWPIAWQRPRNPIGWLLLIGGICYAGSAAAFALLAWGSHPGDLRPFWRLVGTWANVSWPWAIAGLLPLALILFPDGRFVSRHWRWILVPAVVGTSLFAAQALFGSDNLAADLGVRSYLIWPAFGTVIWVGVLTSVLNDLVFVAAVGSVAIRFWRGDDRTRRQLLWLLLAVGVLTIAFTVPDLVGKQTPVSLFAVCLVPLSITVAVLRHQLLDIRLVVSRFVLYLLLSGLVIAAYVGLVALLERFVGLDAVVGQSGPVNGSVLVVLGLAVAFNPARRWLQRRVDRLFYGSRHEPVQALAQVGQHLGDLDVTGRGLQSALQAMCDALRFPAAEILVDGRVLASVGTLPAQIHRTDLRLGGGSSGELVTGCRPGERRLAAADERVLDQLGNLLAVAVRATVLADELQVSRAGVVAAQEEERRRLRRDLHDGLGPQLTGVMLKAGAARRFVATDPTRTSELLTQLENDTASAIEDIRRLIDDLRPPVLDGLGLVGALREYAESVEAPDGSGLRLTVQAPASIEPLPAAVEVAAYRIGTESMTNVIRHARATLATLAIAVHDGELRMEIDDNGTTTAPWPAGVGLNSMGERAALLGGRLTAGPGTSGGHVAVVIPLGAG